MRVFLSYTSRDADAVALVGHLYDGLERAGAKPFLDRKSLNAGDDWNHEVHLELSRCNAAIVVLSASVESAPWVIREAALLLSRKSLAPEFPLLSVALPDAPVVFGDPTLADLGRYQRLAASAPEDVIGEIVTRPLNTTAMDAELRAEDWLAEVLSGVPVATLVAAADSLDITDARWAMASRHRDVLARHVARHALARDPEEAVRDLREVLREIAPETARNFVRLLLPNWVDPGAALGLRVAALEGAKLASLNSTSDFAARHYVGRAARSHTWWFFVSTANVNGGEDQVEAVMREVRAGLKAELGCADDVQLRRELERRADRRTLAGRRAPIVVFLPRFASRELLAKLYDEFPFVLFLVGDDGVDTDADRYGDGLRLRPPLDADRERTARLSVRAAETLLDRAHPRPSPDSSPERG